MTEEIIQRIIEEVAEQSFMSLLYFHPFVSLFPMSLNDPFGIDYTLIGFNEPQLSFLMCGYLPPNLRAETISAMKNHVIDVFDHLLTSSPLSLIHI